MTNFKNLKRSHVISIIVTLALVIAGSVGDYFAYKYFFPSGKFSNKIVKLSKDPSYCLDIQGGDTMTVNQDVYTNQCNASQNSQRLTLNAQGELVVNNGLCMDQMTGGRVVQNKCNNSKNQQWAFDGGKLKSKLNGFCMNAAVSGENVSTASCETASTWKV